MYDQVLNDFTMGFNWGPTVKLWDVMNLYKNLYKNMMGDGKKRDELEDDSKMNTDQLWDVV